MTGADQSHAHGPSIGVYLAIFAALLTLTGVTVAIAFIDLGILNTVAALTIAGVKALLVATFFMHLRYTRRLNGIVAAGGLMWLALLITFTLADFASRGWALGP
jgi:cytochrome c oxidase subunit 4